MRCTCASGAEAAGADADGAAASVWSAGARDVLHAQSKAVVRLIQPQRAMAAAGWWRECFMGRDQEEKWRRPCDVTPKSFIEIMLDEVYADDALVTDSLIQRHYELLLRSGNRKAFTDRASVSDNRPPADVVEKITNPTLILWGAEDTRISPEHAYDFHRRIRGAFLKIYRNTGHWPQEENPVQTVHDVRAFLEGKF